MGSPRTATKSSPRSPHPEKARAQQQRPNAAKNKIDEKKKSAQGVSGLLLLFPGRTLSQIMLVFLCHFNFASRYVSPYILPYERWKSGWTDRLTEAVTRPFAPPTHPPVIGVQSKCRLVCAGPPASGLALPCPAGAAKAEPRCSGRSSQLQHPPGPAPPGSETPASKEVHIT